MGMLRLVRTYPIVIAGAVVLALALVLAVIGQGDAAQLVASAFAGAIAAWTFIGMVREIFRGHWGLDILAVTAIVATLLVGEYIAAVIIVLMLSGGEALEDYAAGRAKRELTALLDRAPRAASPKSLSSLPLVHCSSQPPWRSWAE
ncbi:hypothetical protein GCM10027449_22130 [Sinomonas notoginsengisoli]|uniref:hypothetical protein n=1 Tax=Sinomonas notoginsengisoli TaxID=1457311 RepID=UPI0027E017BC|nr:hypothetical protein [Sinomonas notoginsengisoli]